MDMGYLSKYLQEELVKRYVTRNMETVVIPYDVHKEKTRQTSPRIENEAGRAKKAGDLPGTAKGEAKVVKREVEKKRGKNDPCAKAVKEALGFFKNLGQEYFDALFQAAMEHCKK